MKGTRVLPQRLPADADPVPEADHVDLYDNLRKIPFDRLEAFFKKNLASSYRFISKSENRKSGSCMK